MRKKTEAQKKLDHLARAEKKLELKKDSKGVMKLRRRKSIATKERLIEVENG